MPRRLKHSVRLSEQEQEQLRVAAKDRGYSSPSSLIRDALRNELSGRDNDVTEAENRMAATLERLSRDLSRLHRANQALFAVVDTLVKTFLTCVPEPPREGMSQSVARARDRYDRFVKSAGQAMVGDSQAAMNDLVNRAE